MGFYQKMIEIYREKKLTKLVDKKEIQRVEVDEQKKKRFTCHRVAVIWLFTLKVLYVLGEYLPILSYQ